MTGTASSPFSTDVGALATVRRSGSADLARVAAVYAIGALILCAPAFYNHYPLLFPDLLDYGGDGMKILRHEWPSGSHPPLYGIAIEVLDLERTLWPVVFVQGLVITHLLATVLRTIGVRLSTVTFLGLIAGLAALTSLPWYVSTVMPDIFGGIVVLCLFLLICRPRRLHFVEKTYFAGLAFASLVFHVSFVPVAAGTIAIATAAAFLRRRDPDRPHVALSMSVLLSALALSALVSIRFWGNPSGPPYAPPYLLAHVMVEGPGKLFLQRECAVRHFVLCDYQDDIPDQVDDFMFRSYSPFFSSWQTKKIRDEASAIVTGTFKMYPLQTIELGLRDGLRQLVTFYTEVEQLEELSNSHGGSLGAEFAIRMPFVAKGYAGTVQQRGDLSAEKLRMLNAVHAVVVFLATLVILLQLRNAARRREWIVVELLLAVVIGVAINGLVTGAAVGVFGRFGARLIWLLPFAAVASTLAMTRLSPAIARPRSDPPSERAHSAALSAPAAFRSGARR